MNGEPWGEDTRPAFACLQSGHPGPYRPGIDYRGVACRKCFAAAYPDEGAPRLIATEIRQQERRRR